jgi:hypothetical protein
MRRYRLRTIMALIVIIAVSMWVGMLIERAKQAARGKTIRTTYTVSRPVTKFVKAYTVSRPVKTTTKQYAVMRPVYQVTGDQAQP